MRLTNDGDRMSRKISPLFLLLGVIFLLPIAGCGPSWLSGLGAPLGIQGNPPAGGAAAAGSPPQSASSAQAPTVTPTVSVPDAAGLAQQTPSGQALTAGGWSASGVVLTFGAQTAGAEALIPEVEIAKADQAFTSTPTMRGTPVQPAAGQVQARISVADLAPGQYHWQARFSGAKSGQTGKWTVFGGEDVAFGIVTHAPSIDGFALTGAAQSADGSLVVNKQANPSLQWKVSAEPPASLDHLAYLADHQQQAASAPPAGIRVLSSETQSLPVSDLDDGQWYLHLWAVDKAGQASAPATVAVTIARMPPRFSDVVFRSWATNPLYQTVPIRFTLSRSATVDLTILAQGTSAPVRVYHLGHQPADKAIQAPWDGKDDHGQIVPVGSYAFVVDVVDDVGNRAEARYNGLTITNKVIRVSLGKQSLEADIGSQVFITTVVTTGGQALPTPTGTFEILTKSSPFVFHSPFPKGSPYWYADVTSQHAMLFYQPDADFIHDAPWRKVFGPGSNGPGIPGSTFTGSHGCVELPAAAMPKLYDWTPLGTPVIVTK